MRKAPIGLLTLGILLSLCGAVSAATHTISWAPVTTYTDGTTISGKTVTYSVYWSTSPQLTTLTMFDYGLTQTSKIFDPAALGMTKGGTVYFTMRSALSTGEESGYSPPRAWVVPNPSPALSGISISGPSSVNEGATAAYTATAIWGNGATSSVTPTWRVYGGYASISSAGNLAASAVSANRTVTVIASYTSGGVRKTSYKSVTVANVNGTPASGGTSTDVSSTGTKEPGNEVEIVLSGPASPGDLRIGLLDSSPDPETWRLSWAAVTEYTNGQDLGSGRTVRYNVYWTRDPSLAAGNLVAVATSTSALHVDFRPPVLGMEKNEKIYFTLKAILDSGEQSALSGSLPWRVSSRGPAAPTDGRIETNP